MQDKKIVVEISCIEVWKHISDYIDDDVDPELKARLEFHFERCRHCSAILDGMKNVVALVGDERAFEIPASVNERLTKALAARIDLHQTGAE